MSEASKVFRNSYPGETFYIIGRGPSLRNLRAEHFSDKGPVITMNQSITVVENLNIPNPLYSFQKDGCGSSIINHKCGENKLTVYPSKLNTTLILTQDGFSCNCLSEYKNKIYINPPDDFGFLPEEMSIRICLALAFISGCGTIVFMCCDSFENNLESYDVVTKKSVKNLEVEKFYQYGRDIVLSDLEHSNIPYRIILPH
jgi:hypothetical protein